MAENGLSGFDRDEAMCGAMVEIAILMRQRLDDPRLEDHPLRDELLDWAMEIGARGSARWPASSRLVAVPPVRTS